jgi:two-component system, chemotaxis family, sensor kinase CheA
VTGFADNTVGADLPVDLRRLYLEEVEERSQRLAAGGDALAHGPPDPAALESLIRDAHTIKGSSYMVDRPDVGAASAVLERAWKAVRAGELEAGLSAGRALADLGDLLGRAARDREATQQDLELARRGVEALVFGDVARPPAVMAVPAPQESVDLPGGRTLGGLLASIEGELLSGVTRVDTGSLYRLINRAVEVSLDAGVLADLAHVSFEGGDPQRVLSAWRRQLERLVSEITNLQESAVSLANVSLGDAVDTFPQFSRFVARKLGKEVRFEVQGEDVQADRQIVDLLREPLRHLVVNAIDHGIEAPEVRVAAGKPASGAVALRARVDDDLLVVAVSDDGAGIDWAAVGTVAETMGESAEDGDDLRSLLFRHGFSTRSTPTEFSGGGEGLALVADVADRVKGRLQIDSRPGEGTTVTLALPISLVMQHVLVVAAGDQFWGIPEPAVLSTTAVASSDIRHGIQGPEIRVQGTSVPIISLAGALGMEPASPEPEAVVVSTRSGSIALRVDEVLDLRRVAVKHLGPILEGNRLITGAALLGAGHLVVVVDPLQVAEVVRRPLASDETRIRVLVVDDSAGVRQLIAASLAGKGYAVRVASNAREAAEALSLGTFDVLVVDYAMPGSNGAELVRLLRSSGVTVPIVMVSGVAGPEEQAEAWAAGVDAYLDKRDLRQGALNATLRELLERS